MPALNEDERDSHATSKTRPGHIVNIFCRFSREYRVAWTLGHAKVNRNALLAALSEAFPPPHRNPLLRLERRLNRRLRHRDLIRRYQDTTGRTVPGNPAALVPLLG